MSPTNWVKNNKSHAAISLLDEGSTDLYFPLSAKKLPAGWMTVSWTLEERLGYLRMNLRISATPSS